MILVELVPKEDHDVLGEAKDLLSLFPFISGFNIPDILKLSSRSYHVAADFQLNGMNAIPHFRAIDMPMEKSLEVVAHLVEKGLEHILIVTGDAPASIDYKTYPVSSTGLISEIKKTFPKLHVYGALDPYRHSFREELEYCDDKIRAGVDGFFTQPFFDVELARIVVEQLSKPVFIGVSPVMTEGSKHYWMTRNKAIFPSSFELTETYNATLARDIVHLAERMGHHIYFMPIRENPKQFLSNVFSTTNT